jgi:NMD protein affecting ribosome stability and mRNA decay
MVGCYRCGVNLLHHDYHITKDGQTLCDHCYFEQSAKPTIDVKDEQQAASSEAWSVEDILSREG